jgi:hypothetical protein
VDVDTAKTIEGLLRMIDRVNEQGSLNRLALNGVVVLLSSARRQGQLNAQEISHIDTTFADLADDEALERYDKMRTLFETARKLWEASEPK